MLLEKGTRVVVFREETLRTAHVYTCIHVYTHTHHTGLPSIYTHPHVREVYTCICRCIRICRGLLPNGPERYPQAAEPVSPRQPPSHPSSRYANARACASRKLTNRRRSRKSIPEVMGFMGKRGREHSPRTYAYTHTRGTRSSLSEHLSSCFPACIYIVYEEGFAVWRGHVNR